MAIMERYVIFIKKVASGEEFVSSRRAAAGQHNKVLAEAEEKYPYPNYVVHTVYTERELQNVLDGIKRWCGTDQEALPPQSETAAETAESAGQMIH